MRRTANGSAGAMQNATDLDVRVGRIVLHGVDARAAANLGGRVQAELARLSGSGVPGTSVAGDAPAAGGADALATRIAQSVHARLPR